MKDHRAVQVIGGVIFVLLVVVGFLRIWFAEHAGMGKPSTKTEKLSHPEEQEVIAIKLFFPDGSKLKIEQREIERIFSQKKILKRAVSEFLEGPMETKKDIIPKNTILIGVYLGNDGIAYINLSEDFRRNFHGDAMDEYLLLKGIYETTISNVKVDDVRILIENKEIDTIGGHFLTNHPLKQLVTQEIKLD